MSVAFAIDPAAGIFRAVINGDNAISPSTQKNVSFDIFGAKVHGMTLQDIVPISSFGGPYNYSLTYPPPTHLSHAVWLYDFSFPQALDYCPLAVVRYQKQDGTWTNNYAMTTGSITMVGGFASSQTKLTLFIQSTSTVGASGALPLAVSYRLYGV